MISKSAAHLILMILLFPSVAAAQLVIYKDPSVFAGVAHVSLADVIISWDDRITQKSRSQFEREVRNAFELGIRRMGIVIDPTQFPYRSAWCVLTLLYSDGAVVASQTVQYRELLRRRDTENLQEAEVWSHNAVSKVGALLLEGSRAGQWCAEALELDWRTANPGE